MQQAVKFELIEIVARHAQQDLFADEPSRIWLRHAHHLRDLLKQPIMTLPYGVTPAGMLDRIKGACEELGIVVTAWDPCAYEGMVTGAAPPGAVASAVWHFNQPLGE